MKRKCLSRHGLDNHKDSNGNWVNSWSEKTDHADIRFFTRLGNLWNSMKDRCNPSGLVQRRSPTYLGVTCGFADFNSFAEWAVIQPGFDLFDENGERYAIDKDILIQGNKIYSELSCAFVPQRINNLFVLRAKKKSSVPYGASWDKSRNSFYAGISIEGKGKFLGRFDDAFDAHRAWQSAKYSEFISAAEWYEHQPGFNERVAAAIKARATSIAEDRANRIETEKI